VIIFYIVFAELYFFDVGDVTTLANPEIVEEIKEMAGK